MEFMALTLNVLQVFDICLGVQVRRHHHRVQSTVADPDSIVHHSEWRDGHRALIVVQMVPEILNMI